MYRMHPEHLPHFLRPLSGHSLPHFVVDRCFNITWFGADWQVPMRDVLAKVRQVTVPVLDEAELPALMAPHDFLFTVMHGPPVAWVCHHTGQIFGRAISTRLGREEFWCRTTGSRPRPGSVADERHVRR